MKSIRTQTATRHNRASPPLLTLTPVQASVVCPPGLDHQPDIVRISEAAQRLGIPLPTLRDIRFYSQPRYGADGNLRPANGFASAFLKLGRAVYLDVPGFQHIWRKKQSTGDAHG